MISFKQYLGMLCVEPGLFSFGLALATGFGEYPSDDCKDLSVYPEAGELLNLSVETPLALCRKGKVIP